MTCNNCIHATHRKGNMYDCELNNPSGVYEFEHCERFQQKPTNIVEVVRCKDCINLNAGESVLGKWSYCRWTGITIKDIDNYCSWGEDKHENR